MRNTVKPYTLILIGVALFTVNTLLAQNARHAVETVTDSNKGTVRSVHHDVPNLQPTPGDDNKITAAPEPVDTFWVAPHASIPARWKKSHTAPIYPAKDQKQ